MDERILKWLYDVKFAIAEIDSYFETTEKLFAEYKKNTMLKRAVERDLEIIGEAVNRIIKRNDIYKEKISNSQAIIGLRNHVIHSYDNVSDENIWSILISHIPTLKVDIERLIKERSQN